jgi:hypothetical protein
MWQHFLIFAGCIPPGVLCLAAFFDRHRREQAGEKCAISEKLLRPAGYSLRVQMADIHFDILTLLLISVLSAMASVGALGFPPSDRIGRLVWLTVAACAAAFSGVMAWRKRTQMRRVWRGWIGEQAMAEYLASLTSQGFRVFHDFPLEKENIDHVVVCSAGVFAIETKCWSKRKGKVKGDYYKAVFDGRAIRFPWGATTKPIEQAKRITKRLEDFLSKSTGQRIVVRPIVALPGWYVSTTGESVEVQVLNGKQVSGYIASQPARISAKTLQQIAVQLDQSCRDLEV